jgi:hypothetical protein
MVPTLGVRAGTIRVDDFAESRSGASESRTRYAVQIKTEGEPLHQFIPIVEFAFDTPRGQKTAATMNTGLAYVAGTWQVAAEAIVPLNSERGRAGTSFPVS